MMTLFKNILIPVESVPQTQLALDKALELCDTAETTLHLVAVLRNESVWERLFNNELITPDNLRFRKRRKQAERRLETLRGRLLTQVPDAVVTTTVILYSPLTDHITSFIRRHQIDLAIVGRQRSRKRWLDWLGGHPNDDITDKGNVPVLSVTPGCLKHSIKSILLPVHSFVPERKIEMALSFARKFHAHIHLVTVIDSNNTESKIKVDAFYLTYKILAECGHSPQYKILQGEDSHDTLMRYADQIKVDLILLNPEKKSVWPLRMSTERSHPVNPLSGLHILTLKSYMKKTS
ncbi:MAG: universal stress protein [Chitinophagaceae bacterium]|nr:universal stress protein [Chitinophagaceae bacterium]